MIGLPSAERLDARGATAFIRREDTRIVAVVGPREAGKTSLIASIYDAFQGGPQGDFGFRNSATLFAFEQACHHSRAVSNAIEPTQERTKVGEFGFYHLSVDDKRRARAISVLIGDRSGEEYRAVSDDCSNAKDLVEVARADVITLLIDGKRLGEPANRHSVRGDAQMILQGFVDGGVVSGQPLCIVLTKFDCIKSANNGAELQNDFEEFVGRVRRIYGDFFGEVTAFRVAASPASMVLPRGYGVLELLRTWADSWSRPSSFPYDPQTPSRAYARLTERP